MQHVGMDHAAHGAHAVPNAADMQHTGMNHAAHTGTAPATPAASDGGMQHVGMDHAAHGAHAVPETADVQHTGMDHTTMEHGTPTTPHADRAMHDPAMPDHAGTPHAAAAAAAATPPAAACTCTGAPAAALPREPIPPLTDADRAAAFPTLRAHTMQHGPARTGYLLFDRLEGWDADHGSGQAWEASAWYGGDIDRLWLRSEGERSGGRTEAADLEALYGHAVSPWWDLLVGVKQDFAPGDARTSAAFGVQGMAPYKFEVAATLYVGEGGSASARLEGEYDVLLSNRWILQPRLEAEAAFADDRAHGIGSGLSTLEAGLRLRYEISRRFAPYLGVVHERAFGATADYRREAGEAARDTRVVAGVRVWF
ncbi:copper resistance protein B [Xanthomonas sp. WHRI 7945]